MSPFILFSLSASAILPACLVLLALQDRIGRKAMASSSLVVSGMFTAGTGIALAYQSAHPDPVLLAILSIIGRFGVTVSIDKNKLIKVFSLSPAGRLQFRRSIRRRADSDVRQRSRSRRGTRGRLRTHILQLLHLIYGRLHEIQLKHLIMTFFLISPFRLLSLRPFRRLSSAF